ncbi:MULTISPECIES: flagellar basal body rod protein FlgB [unclassified Campylobacter]|uniref:flagellar basal body rod protein FlgB n=1 Tax=Campylobacter TaxID=194 RepID=UPI001474ABB8|nr:MULTISPECIES: flagellar basal body rod protein FlgB [unclassified Campylobacter]QKF91911.1 flagellar proximal rod protein FlgB [Campylobacter sp. CCUG 57310]
MFAGISSSKSKQLVESALASRNLRQQLISSNIANINTPFYKSRDIAFERALSERAAEIYGKKESKELELANTDEAHLPKVKFPDSKLATIFLRDGHMARNDGNTVDLDVETTELSKNAIMITALDNAMKRDSANFKSVIEASSKI